MPTASAIAYLDEALGMKGKLKAGGLTKAA